MEFVRAVQPQLEITDFHLNYYKLLDAFAKGRIRRLIISVPPQHGKSLAASTLLPAYLLGLDPNLKICIGSYAFSLARRFGLGVQRTIGTGAYRELFPGSFLKGMNPEQGGKGSLRTADEVEMVGSDGGLRLVGREGALTGSRVDVMILDDLYKDAAEANSPVVRAAAWDWYTSVVRTRLHNDSREIVVFTRWHQEDIVGLILKNERVVELHDMAQLDGIENNVWVKVNFEALKVSPPTVIDPRGSGQALWPQRHSRELLLEKQRLDGSVFEALYQGNPVSEQGLLYGDFKTYDTLPPASEIVKIASYTDTADRGEDKLCSICYAVDRTGVIFLTDVLYTTEPMEVTEKAVAQMLIRQNVRHALVESNNGGRGFARSLQGMLQGTGCVVRSFHQSQSKESRILTNSTAVCGSIRMPEDWRGRWSEFATDIKNFKRTFAANRHDDAADTLTGIVETELFDKGRKIKLMGFKN